MPVVVTRGEYVVFDAVTSPSLPEIPGNTPGWETIDYSALYDLAPVIGDDRPIPGVAGRLAVPREEDELVAALPMRFIGSHDWEGDPYEDARIGLRTNLRYFGENVVRPPGTTDGLRGITFHQLDGSTATAQVIVQSPLQVAFSPGSVLARAVLTLIIPAGSLTVSGS